MNAAKHLPGFYNPAGGAVADFGKRTAAWPVNACQAKDMQWQARGLPSSFGRHPQRAARGAGGERGGFIHPSTVMIAIDTRGGEISYPVKRMGAERHACQQGITQIRVRCSRDQKMRRRLKRAIEIAAWPDHRCDPLSAHGLCLFGAARGADDAPTLGLKQRGQGLGRKTIADAKKCLGHRRVIGAKGGSEKG